MDKNTKINLGRAQVEAIREKESKLDLYLVGFFSLVAGVAIAFVFANTVLGLSAVLYVPIISLTALWLFQRRFNNVRAARLAEHETEQAEMRAAETEARIAKARADGSLDRWKK